MEDDDPITSCMLQAWARLYKCHGIGFASLHACSLCHLCSVCSVETSDLTVTSADSDNELHDYDDDDSMEATTLGDKRIGSKTSVLEEQATACNLLYCYADELKEGFYPWIDQVAPTLVPMLKFYFHKDARKDDVSAMPELLLSARLAVEKGIAQGRTKAYVIKNGRD